MFVIFQIAITSIIRCSSDKHIESAWSSSSQPVLGALEIRQRMVRNSTFEFDNAY